MQVTHAAEAMVDPSAHVLLSIEIVALDVATQSLPFRSRQEKLLGDRANGRHVGPNSRLQ